MCSRIVDIRNENLDIGEYGTFLFVFDTDKTGICPYCDVVNAYQIFVIGVYWNLNIILFGSDACLGIFPVDIDIPEIESGFWYRCTGVRCV